ncbi:hypothetical protein Tco_0452408 [Tanacetum coccineum]
MVAYLKKPTGSEGFQEIVDFLNGSHIRYALTKNPTIYVSLIEKFWQTATVRTVDNGEQEINATVDGKEFTITEASVRRHLQLADADGISVLPNTEIFDQLTLMGYVLTDDKLTFQKDKAVHQERSDDVERAATTATTLEAPRDHGGASVQTRFERASKLSYDSPLEGDLRQTKKVYGIAYTKLIMKVKKLEKIVKTSQARIRAKIVVSDDDMALEDSSKQGRMIEEIDQDVGVTLVTPTKVSSQEDQPEDQLGVLSAAKVLTDAARVHTYSRRRAVSTGSGRVSTASRIVSTTGMIQQVNIIIPSSSVTKDKGKAIMTEIVKDKDKGKMEESEDEQTKRTKLQQEQERLGHEAAVRRQEELDEEERQRMARVYEVAQYFTEEEWENIRARVEVDEELSKRLQVEERNKYSEVDQAKMLVDLINQRKKYFAAHKAEAKRNKPMTQAQQRNYMINYIKHMGSHTL